MEVACIDLYDFIGALVNQQGLILEASNEPAR
jgi:hypothetical protein